MKRNRNKRHQITQSLQDGIQTQCPGIADKQCSERVILTIQCANVHARCKDTERIKAISELLRRQMSALTHSVQVQDHALPIRCRVHSPKDVELLMYNAKMLIDTLDRYVLPHYEMIHNSKN